MAAITIEGVPDELVAQLRVLDEQERRSVNQQTIRLLEEALEARRPAFMDLYESFKQEHGPSPLQEDDLLGLRSQEEGRPSPFGEPEGAER